MLTTLLSFIFVLGLLIFVHELGHFFTAKMVGIRVERFSLGFPPRMVGKKIGETDYCISWLPLGGYVKMAGMIDESLDETTIKGEPWEYQSKPVWQRVIVISAGSFMNILAAVIIFALITYSIGIPDTPDGAMVSQVLSGKPGESIGLMPGDIIISINEQPVKTSEDLIKIVNAKPNVVLPIEWNRDGKLLSATVTPELIADKNIGQIGIQVGTHMLYKEAGFIEALQNGVMHSYTVIKLVLYSLKLIITGQESFKDAIGGPIIIAKMAGETAKMGFQSLLAFTAFISLNLGFFNMLPFPVLDGGHLVFLIIEGIRRKPMSIKTKIVIQKIGMAFLLALMVFVIFNDIRRIL